MNGEPATIDPVSGLRSGAPGTKVRSAKKAKTPNVAQIAYFNPRVSSAVTPAPSAVVPSGALYGPMRGSMNLSVKTETTIVRSKTEAMPNQRLDARPIDLLGSIR